MSNEDLDDMLCYVKLGTEEQDTEYDCLKCDGYNATCHDYVSRRTMDEMNKTGYSSKVGDILNTNISELMENVKGVTDKKIRQYVKQWRQRKNNQE